MAQGYGSWWRAARACGFVWLLAVTCPLAFAASWTVEGRVVGVSDGDTITVLDRAKENLLRLRLVGYDKALGAMIGRTHAAAT
jgi:hypothetical protein